jgi:hypothetical protein
MTTRAVNESKFTHWEDLPGNGRRYWLDVQGRSGWRARCIKVVDDEEKTNTLLTQSQWINKLESKAKTVFMFTLENNEISDLNKYLVENGIAVSAVVPTRSLEDYFLKITDEVV